MIITKNENIRPFDVDNCLIIHTSDKTILDSVRVIDPVTKKTLVFRKNLSMIRLLKEEHQRGGHIIVWSRGGWEWARNVVQALNLEPYVHQVLSKPVVYFDDTPVKKWMKDRVFIGPDEPYKRTHG